MFERCIKRVVRLKNEYWMVLSSWWFIFSNINLLSFETIYELNNILSYVLVLNLRK